MSDRKIAIVTGGGTGIGQAVCLRLARDGYAVVIGYSRTADGARETERLILEAGGAASVHKVDVALEADVLSLFADTLERHGGVDVVINNAGIGHASRFAKIAMEDYDRIFAVNSRGTFMMCREAARHIRDNGRIVNISTGATRANPEYMALYVASKMAVEGYSKVLARELAPRGITVNCVSPGMTDTPMLEGGDAPALRRQGAALAAAKRLGQPQDIADGVAALVGNDGRWITGQIIHVDGGTIIV